MTTPPPAAATLAGRSSRLITLAAATLFAAVCIPVFTHPLLPLSDYANHLSRIHVINALDRDPVLAQYYLIDWEIIPNLMIDLIVPLLNRIVDIYVAGQLFVALAFLLIVSGTFALNRAIFGEWTAAPLLSMALLYNGVLLVGVLNYVFGIGLALWALAAWVMLRAQNLGLRLAASTLFVIGLFFCHLFAVGLYGLGLLAIELHRLWPMRGHWRLQHVIEFAAAGFPFAAVVLLMLVGPTINAPGASAFWEWGGKLHGIELALSVYHPQIGYSVLAAIAVAAVLAWRAGVLRFHPLGWFVLAIGLTVYVAMPRALFAAHLADQRLPIAIAFMLIACFSLDLRRQFVRRTALAVIAAAIAVKTVEVQYVWDDLESRTNEFLASVHQMHRGARVLVVHGSGGGDENITNADIMHAASLATIERSALVTTAFTVRGKHILQVRDQYRRFVETEDNWPPSLPYVLEVAERGNPARDYFWEFWPRHYDYVYILFTKRGWRCSDRKHLTLVHDGEGFQLYRVITGIADGVHAVPEHGG